jgi:hypothetical protein
MSDVGWGLAFSQFPTFLRNKTTASYEISAQIQLLKVESIFDSPGF